MRAVTRLLNFLWKSQTGDRQKIEEPPSCVATTRAIDTLEVPSLDQIVDARAPADCYPFHADGSCQGRNKNKGEAQVTPVFRKRTLADPLIQWYTTRWQIVCILCKRNELKRILM
jgi:hypothetical protein